MQRSGRVAAVADPALAWSKKLAVEVGGAGTVAHAGAVLPRLLADQLGLTADLAGVVARAGFTPRRHRGRLLVDAACALAAGATGLSDIEALTRQEELFGPGGGASDTTVLRGLDELADLVGAGGHKVQAKRAVANAAAALTSLTGTEEKATTGVGKAYQQEMREKLPDIKAWQAEAMELLEPGGRAKLRGVSDDQLAKTLADLTGHAIHTKRKTDLWMRRAQNLIDSHRHSQSLNRR